MNRKSYSTNLFVIGLFQLAWAMSFGGCATQGKSLALGGTLGAGTGAIAGGLADPGKDGQYRTRNVLIGTAVGGVAGLVAGALVGDGVDAQKQEAFAKGQASVKVGPIPSAAPRLQEAKVEAHWVDSQIIGNRFVSGHWEYQIVDPSRWEEVR